MTVYHGSFVSVPSPDVLHSRRAVDFGPGFYVTPIYDQASKWAERFKKTDRQAIVSSYEYDDTAADEFNVLVFDAYSEEWLDFILSCRSERDRSNYDIVSGGVANDKVFNTVQLYFDGLIEKAEAIKRLQFEKPNLQICFRSQSAIDKLLVFKGSDVL